MINFRAELYPVGHKTFDYRDNERICTAEGRQATMDRIIKVLMKYRLPYDMRTVDGFTLIEVTGEPYKRVVNRRIKPPVAPEPAQPAIVCTQHESGRYEWHYTKRGRRVMASFPYDAEREVQMRKEIAKGIDKSILGGCSLSYGLKEGSL